MPQLPYARRYLQDSLLLNTTLNSEPLFFSLLTDMLALFSSQYFFASARPSPLP
jgi:hypothetical protein